MPLASGAHTGQTEHQFTVNCQDYGATPNDGTDDTTALRNCLAAPSLGAYVLPPGTYNTSGTLNLGRDGMILRGAGAPNATRLYSTAAPVIRIDEFGGDKCIHGARVEDLHIIHGRTSGDVIYSSSANENSGVSGVYISSPGDNGIRINRENNGLCPPQNWSLDSLHISGGGSASPTWGINVNYRGKQMPGKSIRNVTVTKMANGIYLRGCTPCVVEGVNIEYASAGVVSEQGFGSTFTGVTGWQLASNTLEMLHPSYVAQGIVNRDSGSAVLKDRGKVVEAGSWKEVNFHAVSENGKVITSE